MRKLLTLAILLIAFNTYGQDQTFYGKVEVKDLPLGTKADSLVLTNSVGELRFMSRTNYLSGITGGASGSLDLDNTISGISGIISKDGLPWIHNYQNTIGGGAIPVGQNIFFGINSGNFTFGSTATAIDQASWNYGFGVSSLHNLTTGSWNVGIGDYALENDTSGRSNIAIGSESLRMNQTSSFNVGVGTNTLLSLLSGGDNMAIGKNALQNVTTGSYNVSMGRNSGFWNAAGALLTQIDHSVLVGYDARPLNNANTNEIVIGSGSRGFGSNTATIGSTSTTSTILSGAARLRAALDMGSDPYSLATKKYVDDIALSGTVIPSSNFPGEVYSGATANEITQAGDSILVTKQFLNYYYWRFNENVIVGENVANADILYHSTDGKWYKAAASNLAAVRSRLVMAVGSFLANETALVYNLASIRCASCAVPVNTPIYLSLTPGSFTYTPPSSGYVRRLGVVHPDTENWFPDEDRYNYIFPSWDYVSANGSMINGVGINNDKIFLEEEGNTIVNKNIYSQIFYGSLRDISQTWKVVGSDIDGDIYDWVESSAYGIGAESLLNNTGDAVLGIGEGSLYNNTGDYNTALGYYSGWSTDPIINAYENVTLLGAFTVPTQSNQVVLGNASVTSIRASNPSYVPIHDKDLVTKDYVSDFYNFGTYVNSSTVFKKISAKYNAAYFAELTFSNWGLTEYYGLTDTPPAVIPFMSRSNYTGVNPNGVRLDFGLHTIATGGKTGIGNINAYNDSFYGDILSFDGFEQVDFLNSVPKSRNQTISFKPLGFGSTYTIVQSDLGLTFRHNGTGAQTFTLNTGLTLVIGEVFKFYQANTGAITINGNVTFFNKDGKTTFTTAGKGSVVTLVHMGSNEWFVSGDLL